MSLQPSAVQLLSASSDDWLAAVLADFDRFLVDHAHAEKKASGMAMSMLLHYPDKPELVSAMTDLAVEELVHFKEVMKLLQRRQLSLSPDTKDLYVAQLHKLMRKGSELYFLDRLLIAAIIEARGHERFGLIAKALPSGDLKTFYRSITNSEGRHTDLFLELALNYFNAAVVEPRLQELLERETGILANLSVQAALH